MLKKMMTIVTMKKNYKETIMPNAMYASEDGLKLGIFEGYYSIILNIWMLLKLK